jgi:hypothetical protein
MKAYMISWSRQKGKLKKEGITVVAAVDLNAAIKVFTHVYSERVIEAIYKEADDVLIEGQQIIK